MYHQTERVLHGSPNSEVDCHFFGPAVGAGRTLKISKLLDQQGTLCCFHPQQPLATRLSISLRFFTRKLWLQSTVPRSFSEKL